MTRLFMLCASVGLITITGIALSAPAWSATIERACLQSDRGSGQRGLCGCIQDAANLTLNERDQRLAATFFTDPHRAQEIRQSSRRHDTAFWDRYRNFGAAAESFCQS
jgi:hypothetical protein